MKNQVFDFWKENQLDQHFQLKSMALVTAFTKWLQHKDLDYLDYYSSDRIIRFFITDKENDGLNSVFEEDQFNDLYEILKPVYLEHCRSLRQV